MERQTLFVILAILVYATSLAMLIIVSRVSRPRRKIWIKSSTPLVMPQICVITGAPAAESHAIRFYKGTPFSLQTGEVALPFARDGWERHCHEFPVSLAVFRKGLDLLRRIPLSIGAFLALYIWAPWGGFICGLIAIYDVLRRRRPRVKILGFSSKDEFRSRGEVPHGIGLATVSDAFPDELLRLNPGASVGRKFWQVGW